MRRAILLAFFLTGSAWADTGFTSTIKVTETDNSPSCVVGQIKFSAGSVTCAGQTATVSSGGGGNFVLKTGDSMSGDLTFTSDAVGPVLADSAGCTWRVGVNTSGVLTTALLACPGSNSMLMEDGTKVLMEDSTFILLES